MIKKITSSLFVAAISLSALAQSPITLDNTQIPVMAGQVPLGVASSTGFQAPARGANQVWNYGQTASFLGDILNFQSSANPQFPAGSIYRANLEREIVPGYVYYYNEYYQGSPSHYAMSGIELEPQAYTMAPVTGNPNDSLFIPAQTHVLPAPAPFLQYPATYNSTWQSNYQVGLNVIARAPALGLNNAPMEKRSYVTVTDSVIGWGMIRIPTATGPSIYYDVLMVKRQRMTRDSVFLNGNPAPAMLLMALQQTQGQITEENSYAFYRSGSRTPLMRLGYGSSPFTQLQNVTFDRSANVMTGRPEQLTSSLPVSLYPNPVAGNSLELAFEKPDGKAWQIRLMDLTGRTCHTETITGTEGRIMQPLQLPASLSNGFYTWQLSNSQGLVQNCGKLIVQR